MVTVHKESLYLRNLLCSFQLKNMARQLESNSRLTRIDIISPCAAVVLPAILEHAPSTLTNLLAHNLVCMTESLPTRSIGNVGALLHQKFANLEQLTLPCLPGIWQHLIQMPQLRRLQFLGIDFINIICIFHPSSILIINFQAMVSEQSRTKRWKWQDSVMPIY